MFRAEIWSETWKIDEKTLLLIQLDKSLPVLDFQKVLIHNLSKNMFIGGSVVYSTNNSYMIKELNRDFRMKENINSKVSIYMYQVVD